MCILLTVVGGELLPLPSNGVGNSLLCKTEYHWSFRRCAILDFFEVTVLGN